MRKGTKRLLGTLTLAGGVGVGALISAAPASANSCFWVDTGQRGASRCFNENVTDFSGMRFNNSTVPMEKASSFQNTNLILNDYAHSEPNYGGVEQELEDETRGNLIRGVNDHLRSYDAN
jgi:hypothetical protein